MSVKPFPLSVARQFPGRGRQVWTTGHQNRRPKSQIMIEKREVNLELLPSPRRQTHCTTSPSLKAGSASPRNPGKLLETEPEVHGQGETARVLRGAPEHWGEGSFLLSPPSSHLLKDLPPPPSEKPTRASCPRYKKRIPLKVLITMEPFRSKL